MYPADRRGPLMEAQIHESAGRVDDAERALRDLIAKDPLDAAALNFLGYMLADRGDRLPEAIELVQRALKVEPGNPSYLDSLGWAYVKQGNLALADKPLTDAAAQLPENSVIQDHLGELRFRQQRYADAAAAWERALAGDGESIDRRRDREEAARRARAHSMSASAGSRFHGPGSRLWFVLLAAVAACGPPARPALPSGTGTPFAEFASAYQEAVAECSTIQAVTAELALSGRAGSTKLRGRIIAGLAAPADIVLEGLHFGKPIFVLVGRGGTATLFLPRDNRILRGEEPSAIVEALAGVPLSPAELRSAVAGCGLQTGLRQPAGEPSAPTGSAVESANGTVYLRRIEGRWRVAAAMRNRITVQYGDFAAGRPATVFVKTDVADIALRVSGVEINVPLDPRVFDFEVPKDAAPLTLEELRRAGPLGERGQLTP